MTTDNLSTVLTFDVLKSRLNDSHLEAILLASDSQSQYGPTVELFMPKSRAEKQLR